ANLIESLGSKNVAEVYVATLLFKPEALEHTVPLDYVAIEIPNDFIVGYGLDYDGYGRNLRAIYTLIP
ncbi:MAG TPA: hypoxanthine phosphoribosyltransferase, partial [Paludibacteraceae bacterium]|nr:hypoxanthine phosphoribosyltransferase [Paludibacteraceae bacterium]